MRTLRDTRITSRDDYVDKDGEPGTVMIVQSPTKDVEELMATMFPGQPYTIRKMPLWEKILDSCYFWTIWFTILRFFGLRTR